MADVAHIEEAKKFSRYVFNTVSFAVTASLIYLVYLMRSGPHAYIAGFIVVSILASVIFSVSLTYLVTGILFARRGAQEFAEPIEKMPFRRALTVLNAGNTKYSGCLIKVKELPRYPGEDGSHIRFAPHVRNLRFMIIRALCSRVANRTLAEAINGAIENLGAPNSFSVYTISPMSEVVASRIKRKFGSAASEKYYAVPATLAWLLSISFISMSSLFLLSRPLSIRERAIQLIADTLFKFHVCLEMKIH